MYEITPSNNGLDQGQHVVIAEAIGLDRTDFLSCTKSEVFADIVEEHYQEGLSLGITGTPGTFISTQDGREVFVGGALPYAIVDLVIEMLLAGEPQEVPTEFLDLYTNRATQEEFENFFNEKYPDGLQLLEGE
jgi:hypothetical protein